jgi:hypothetical protein
MANSLIKAIIRTRFALTWRTVAPVQAEFMRRAVS